MRALRIKAMWKRHLVRRLKRWDQANLQYWRKIKSTLRIWIWPWENWKNWNSWRNPGYSRPVSPVSGAIGEYQRSKWSYCAPLRVFWIVPCHRGWRDGG